MTPEQLAEIQGRCDRATDGPWDTDGYASVIGPTGDQIVTAPCYESKGQQLRDDIFIAHAREDIPALISHIDAQAAEIKRLGNVDAACSDRIGELLTRVVVAERERDELKAENFTLKKHREAETLLENRPNRYSQLTRYKAVAEAVQECIAMGEIEQSSRLGALEATLAALDDE